MKNNYYQLFNISYTASDKEITRAYKKMLISHHPDTNHGHTTYSVQDIIDAYKTLIDPETRFQYNLSLIRSFRKNTKNIFKKYLF